MKCGKSIRGSTENIGMHLLIIEIWSPYSAKGVAIEMEGSQG